MADPTLLLPRGSHLKFPLLDIVSYHTTSMLPILSVARARAFSSLALHTANTVSGFLAARTTDRCSAVAIRSPVPSPFSASPLHRTIAAANADDGAAVTSDSLPLRDAFRLGDYYVWMYTSHDVPPLYK